MAAAWKSCLRLLRPDRKSSQLTSNYSTLIKRKEWRGLPKPASFTHNSVACYRAAVLQAVGQPLVVKELRSHDKLKDGEVRISVRACGVNASDILVCHGEYGVQPKAPFVPGFEVCGEVSEVGPKVDDMKVGDLVVALNKQTWGGFAEECISLAKDVWVVPQSVDPDIGASLIDSYATAMLGLVRRAKLEKNDSVVVTAAAGGLGLAAVDLAANVYKAKVIGVCGTEDKASLVRDKGAFAALKYTSKDLHKKVMEVTSNKGAKIILDAVGGDIFNDALKCVAFEGKVIVAGFASRKIPHVLTNELLPKSFALIGVSLSHYRDANFEVYREVGDDVISLYEDGLISPQVAARFPLDEVNDALDYLAQRKSTGKVILTLS